MEILIIIVIALISIIGLLLIVGIFIKKDFSIVKEVVVNKPKATVFDYIKLLRNQNNFSVWGKMDPKMKKEFIGTDGAEGFVSAWDSENKSVGIGEQEILKVTEGERVDYELRFIKPFEATNYASLSTQTVFEDKTKVQWEFSGKMKYPMNLMLLFMDMETKLGDDLGKGLQNLKNLLENKNLSAN
jgi:uncharacterized protein YndB with AHSA1/START domain